MKRKNSKLEYTDIGCAKLDTSRWERQGIPEAIFCPGKTHEQIKKVIRAMLTRGRGPVLVTRTDKTIFRIAKKINSQARWYPEARMVVIRPEKRFSLTKSLAVVTAGTADIPVAEEASVTVEAMGNVVHRIYDVGVAGVHRLLTHKHILEQVSCVIVCAGMEGALASVVGGLVGVPVVAVPTSIGYGISLQGVAPLLTMLNSCSPNVSVVNIDNGFGAGVIGHLIAKKHKSLL